MNAGAYFTTLARYNVWATERLLSATGALADGDYRRDVGLFFRSVHGTLAHLLVAEHHLWLRRFAEGVSPVLALDADLAPDRRDLAAQLMQGARCWEPLVAGHVFNHATHHRGQITAALTALGQPCPELDLVYFLQSQTSQET